MDDGVGSDDAVGARVRFDDLELYGPHSSTHEEDVPLVDGAVSFQEVRLQVDFKQVSMCQTKKVTNYLMSCHSTSRQILNATSHIPLLGSNITFIADVSVTISMQNLRIICPINARTNLYTIIVKENYIFFNIIL